MLAGAQRLNGLGRMQKDRCADIYRVNCRVLQSFVKSRPDAHAVGCGFRGIACDETVETASRFELNSGNDPFGRDIANADDDPVEHAKWLTREKQRPAWAGLRNRSQTGTTSSGRSRLSRPWRRGTSPQS